MINVTDATKSAYLGSTAKILTITFPNANITITNNDLVSQAAELTETLETERTLQFKGCNASQFKFRCADIVRDLRGEYCEVKIQAGNTEEIPLFKGYVDSQENQTHEDVLTEFTAYDVLYKVGNQNMQSWVDGLTFPITVKNFRNSLFTTLGITQESVTLVNDSLSISANVKGFLENPTALDLMRWICQLNGRFGQIGRDGKFHYRKLKTITEGLYPSSETFPSSTTYPSGENADEKTDMSQYNTLKYQPYQTATITKVSIYDNSGVNQGNYGSGSNVLSVSENPIAFSVNMSTAAQNLYNEVKDIWYIPVITLNCCGKPWLECGDVVMSNTKKNIVRTYILSRHLTGIQALFDEIQSDSDKTMPPVKTTAMTGINANRQSVIEIQADIVQMNQVIATKATITDLNATNARVGALEADHVTTAQLTAVQGDIQTLNTTKLNASTASATYATITSLNTTNATVSGKLDASTAQVTYATITSLNAVSGRVGSLEADHVSVSSLDAVSGRVSTIESNYITADNINAKSFVLNAGHIGALDASKITSGTINADRISSDVFNGRTVWANTFGATYRFMLNEWTLGVQNLTFVTGVDFTNKTVTTRSYNFMTGQK